MNVQYASLSNYKSFLFPTNFKNDHDYIHLFFSYKYIQPNYPESLRDRRNELQFILIIKFLFPAHKENLRPLF